MSPPSSPTSQSPSQLQVQMVGQQQQEQEQRSGMEQLDNSMSEDTAVDLVIANLNSVQDDKEQCKVLSKLIQIMPTQCFQVFVEYICRDAGYEENSPDDDDVECNTNEGVNEQNDALLGRTDEGVTQETIDDNEQNEGTTDQEMAEDNSQNTNDTTDTKSNTKSKKRKAHQSTDTLTRRETRSNKKSKT